MSNNLIALAKKNFDRQKVFNELAEQCASEPIMNIALDKINDLRQQLDEAKTVSDHNLRVYQEAAESLRHQLASCQAALADTEALEIGTGERLAKVEQQLAAAIAACKLKDAALENVEGMLDELRYYPVTYDEIIEALAIQPDDSALKAWLGEPACEAIAESGAAVRWWWSDYGLSLQVGTKLYAQKELK